MASGERGGPDYYQNVIDDDQYNDHYDDHYEIHYDNHNDDHYGNYYDNHYMDDPHEAIPKDQVMRTPGKSGQNAF